MSEVLSNLSVRESTFAMQISCESSCKDVPVPLFGVFRIDVFKLKRWIIWTVTTDYCITNSYQENLFLFTEMLCRL